jgi:hypothetical protein
MSNRENNTTQGTKIRVSVIMACERVQHGRWQVPRWELKGVVAGENLGRPGAEPTRIYRSIDQGSIDQEQYLWPDLVLNLYKDGAESYWYNLMGETPSVFVVCRAAEESSEGRITPYLVTANCDEASAHGEVDDLVFSAPLPPEVYRKIEAFVLENYTPREKKKRKRKNWLEETENGQRTKHRRGDSP